MAIAADATSQSALQSFPNLTVTWSHTCTGADRCLFVTGFGNAGGGGYNISGMTYNGVAMTEIARVQVPSDRWIGMYYLAAPATGANNIVMTVVDPPAPDAFAGLAASYTGVHQVSPIDSFNTATASATSITPSTTVVGSDCWLVMGLKTDGGDPAAGTGTTDRISNGFGLGHFDSNGTVGTGSQSLQATFVASVNWAAVIASIAPSAAPAAGQPTMRRWGGVPAMGGTNIGNKGTGRMWGRTRSGIIVPRRLAA
jgi:hypothetical protein